MSENEMREIEELESALTIIYGDDDEIEIDWYSTARANHENGIRKVPDGAVVLNIGKNNEALDEKTIEFFVKHNAEVRKETAMEIFADIERTFHDFYSKNSILTRYDVLNHIAFIADKYGVEVDE